MKRKLLIFLLGIILLILLPTPQYRELNHLIIIHSIKVHCQEQVYELTLKEIIPKKEENGIRYTYKEYKETGSNLKEIKDKIENKTRKEFYYRGTKKIITNCPNPHSILSIFSLPKNTKTDTILD